MTVTLSMPCTSCGALEGKPCGRHCPTQKGKR